MFTFRSYRLLPSGWFAGGAIAIAAACVFAPPAASIALAQSGSAVLVPAALSSEEPTQAAPAIAPTPRPTTELGSRIEGAPGLAIAGEKLNLGLLRRFYAVHGYEPVWTTRQAQAESLLRAVLRAGDHGLDPELFHASLLRGGASLSPLDRELLLSNAFLSYADALARGIYPVERRMDDLDLTPDPIDIAATLTAALTSFDPGAAIEALAPTTPNYRALRQALQTHQVRRRRRRHGDRVRQIKVNLERQRWLPRQIPSERVWVNVADAHLTYFRGDRPIFTTRVIVGADRQAEPGTTHLDRRRAVQPAVERAVLDRDEGDPAEAGQDPNYLSKQRMVMRPNGGIQQQSPGAHSGWSSSRCRTGMTSTCTTRRTGTCSRVTTVA